MKNRYIPKIIHYCWFGKQPLPPLALKCLSSWRRYLPDYEIKQWDETNFDVNIIPYTKQAYEAKKYAFVSDYARFWILYNYGGIYFDTDVEVIKTMSKIINSGPFMGCENWSKRGLSPNTLGVAPGLGIGAYNNMSLFKEILDKYQSLNFKDESGAIDTTTVVHYVTEILVSKGLRNTPMIQQVADVIIYPKEYFCPLDYNTGELKITTNTVTIHHYAASWHGKKEKIYKFVSNFLGEKAAKFISRYYKILKG